MISFFVTAFAKGDFAQAWAWSDDPEKAKGEDEKASPSANSNGAKKLLSHLPLRKRVGRS